MNGNGFWQVAMYKRSKNISNKKIIITTDMNVEQSPKDKRKEQGRLA